MMAGTDDDRGSPPVLPGERLQEAWRRLRAEKLADRGFRRRAAANPLIRPIATRSAGRLFDLAAGFVYSQILRAVIDLDLLGRLESGPKTADDLAGPLGLSPAAARRLLDAAAALDLVEARSDGAYGIAALGSVLQAEDGVGAMIAHHDMLYDDLRDPVALLRGEAGETRLSRFWPYAGDAAAPEGGAQPASGDGEADAYGPYSELMARSQSFIADDVLDVFSFGDRNSLLDLGGGEGVFAEAAAERWPHLEIRLVDLPEVAARAESRLRAAGLAGRVSVRGADLFDAPALGAADVVSFVRVLHDHEDDAALALLRLAHRALTPGGEVMIAEPIAGMPGARRVGHAYFGFYLLAMGSGRARSAVELADLLARAGFWNVRTRYARGALPLAVTTARRRGEGPIWRL